MKRRQIIKYAGTTLLAAIGTSSAGAIIAAPPPKKPNATPAKIKPRSTTTKPPLNAVTVQWLGHSCFLFSSNGFKVLVNPFQPIGCTAKYRAPQVNADLVLISSYLLDEGFPDNLTGNARILSNPGDYEIKNIKFQGITIPHDRNGGRRFGTNTAWRWQQAGVNILHLGGAAGTIELEQRILMGSPDVLLIPVGGGDKIYNAQEAKQIIDTLKPKLVIPTQYRTPAADPKACDIQPIDKFLEVVQGWETKRLDTDRIAIAPRDLPKDRTVVRVFNYKF
jgi:L-ascorbate metabolism protein UlaG (beta-lactamase superfamily)